MSTNLSQLPLVDQAYDPSQFQEQSQIWARTLNEHLSQVLASKTDALNVNQPAELVALAESALSEDDSQKDQAERFQQLLKLMLDHGQNLHHPGYIGHQVPASLPIAGLFDAVGSVTNQPMAIYEMGPWATAVEHALIRKLTELVGWNPDTSSGLLTHGGSLANLTALLTARNVRIPGSWENGCPDNAVIVAHTDAHYCVSRSAGMLGMGTKQIRSVPLTEERRMDPSALRKVLRECHQNDEIVVAVVAVACATPVGAFDRLSAIADVCEEAGVWLHVDAAHGGGVLMSDTHRHLAAGIDRADSVVWDAHKMLFVPALCAAVLYRKRDHQLATFQQNAPYLFDSEAEDPAVYDGGIRTVECTKRACGFGLWGSWCLFGRELFQQLVDRVFAVADYAAKQLDLAADFERPFTQDANIIVYRHLPESISTASVEKQNAFQRKLREQIVRTGDFYIVQTVIDEIAYLRMVVMNPVTGCEQIDQLLHRIRITGQQIVSESDS